MTEATAADVSANLPKLVGINKFCDIGALVLEDCQSFAGKTDVEIVKETKKNFCALFKELFDLKREQASAHGEDGEILEYTKSLFTISLPEAKVVTPREKPIPKEKMLTKWETFRKERGMPARQKRSRLIFDATTNDWVPRWGKGSKKSIEETHNWLMEEKAGQEGQNPFTLRKQEKKMVLEKEKLKQLKNEVRAAGGKNRGDQKIINQTKDGKETKKDHDSGDKDVQKQAVKKRERKALDKSFKMAQLSTASMGKFDKKVNKSEPDAPKSNKILKKKSNSQLDQMSRDPKQERDRNLKLLNWMARAEEVAQGSHSGKGGKSKADAHLDTNKLVNRSIKKENRTGGKKSQR